MKIWVIISMMVLCNANVTVDTQYDNNRIEI